MKPVIMDLVDFIHKHLYNTYNTRPIKKPRKGNIEQLPYGYHHDKKYEPNRGLTR